MSSHGTLKKILFDETVISSEDILIPGIHHNIGIHFFKYKILNVKSFILFQGFLIIFFNDLWTVLL